MLRHDWNVGGITVWAPPSVYKSRYSIFEYSAYRLRTSGAPHAQQIHIGHFTLLWHDATCELHAHTIFVWFSETTQAKPNSRSEQVKRVPYDRR